jgi:hypothetical protein
MLSPYVYIYIYMQNHLNIFEKDILDMAEDIHHMLNDTYIYIYIYVYA